MAFGHETVLARWRAEDAMHEQDRADRACVVCGEPTFLMGLHKGNPVPLCDPCARCAVCGRYGVTVETVFVGEDRQDDPRIVCCKHREHYVEGK